MPSRVYAGFVCLLSIATITFAQEFRASISGHVLDSSGAAVPQAKIQATNIANNEVTSAVSDSSGSYTIPLLRPGDYRITATAPGFKQFVREDVPLLVGQAAGIDIKLELGEITQTVEVTGQAELLDTQSANRSGVVNTREVAELPLNSRNPFMLGLTASGVTFRGASIWQRPFDNGAIANWIINGSWQSNNEFLLDGAANNAQMGGNNVAYVPIVDAVQEFTMMQNTYDAQYGHTMGGILNTVLKSGTNTFHGSGWEFMRRKFLDANTFQNTSIGQPRTDHYLDQYGGQVSGPIFIPRILKKDGYVRLFYLGSFENYREGTPGPLLDSFPTPEMRTGDFSHLVDATGQKITIYDPLTAIYDASGNIVKDRQPFPGNIIPPERISTVAAAVTKYMPMPNTTTPGYRYGTGNLSLPSVFDRDKFYNMIMKFDWNLGDKHRFFMREASNDRTENRPVNGIVGPGEDGQLPFQRINDAYVLDWTATLTPTMVVDVRASNNRFIEKGTGFDNAGFDLTSLGLPKSLIGQLPQPTYFGYWHFTDYNNLGRYQSINITNSYGLEGSITKIKGSHTLKAGIDTRRIHYILQNSGNILEFDSSNRNWTQAIWNQAGNGLGGDEYANFLLGYASGGSSNYPLYPFFRNWYVAPFFQDDWKVNNRLTINWGFRYDVNAPPDEKYNRLNAAFDPNVPSPIAQMISPDMLARYPQLANLKGGLQFAGVNGYPTKAANIDWRLIQPRFGFALRLGQKWVMRGGYGMYYANPNNDWLQTQGFSTSTSMVTSPDGGRTPYQDLLSNPYPNGIQVPPGSSLGPLTYAGRSINWFNPDFQVPRSHQFSFGFQYQLSQGSTIEASYVGNRIDHLQTNIPFDTPTKAQFDQCGVLYGGSASYCNQLVPNPFKGLAPFIGTSLYTNSTTSLFQMMRPFPQFTGGTEYGMNYGHLWYNSLQVNYNHRLANGLTVQANYTLSKQIERWGYQNWYDRSPQEGLYYADRPHFIKLTMVYQLPFGKGRHFAPGAHGVAGKLISGWEMNTFFTDSPLGEPANMPGNAFALKNPSVTPHWGANQVRIWNNCVLQESDTGVVTPMPYSVSAGCGTDWNNYYWLIVPPSYTPGQVNSYRSGNMRVQGTYTMDASVSKETVITERVKAQFRVEAFNALNHFNYMLANVNTNPTDPNFGTIIPHTLSTTATTMPRQLQLGFKVLW